MSPTFTADYFGPKHVGAIMGLIMTAQGFGAILGPMLLASARKASGSYAPALSIFALIMAISAIVPFVIRPPAPSPAESEMVAKPAPA